MKIVIQIETLEKFLTPFKNEVKTPAKITTTPCPIENKNNIKAAKTMLFVNVAKLIIPAKIGVEQGLEAKAKRTPIIKGYTNKLAPLFCGNFLTTGAKLSSIKPKRFKPKTSIKEAKNNIQ